MLLAYVSEGGAAYVRYLLPALPALAVLMAYGLAAARIRGWMLATFVGATSALLTAATLIMLARELHFREARLGGAGVSGWLSAGVRATGISPPGVVTWLFIAVCVAASVMIPLSLLKIQPKRV
jgi:hypothetical protein